MKIVNHYTDIAHQTFDSDAVKGVAGRIIIGKDDGAPHFCMRIFTISPDGFTPRHSHEWEHEILVHSGAGQVYNSGEWHDISGGTALFIPGNEEHQLRNTGTEDLVFACLIPKGAPEL